MLHLLETILAFATVMLAASLFVSAIVQLVKQIGSFRSRGLQDMLKTVLHGFRVQYCDEDALKAEKGGEGAKEAKDRSNEIEERFVADVLAEPMLQTREAQLRYADDPARIRAMIEYVNADDLVAIAHSRSIRSVAPTPGDASKREYGETAKEIAELPDVPLPVEWVGEGKAYATTANFARYVQRWFVTIEGTASERFKQSLRRFTIVVSCTVVVLFNIDGFRLIGDLYRNSQEREAILARSHELEVSATRLGVPGAPAPTPEIPLDTTTREFALELQKTATILDEANLGIGWQNSWIVKRWYAYRSPGSRAALPPSLLRLVFDTFFWLTGLMFTCVMLSYGSPFWVSILSRLLPLRNEVERKTMRRNLDSRDLRPDAAGASRDGGDVDQVVPPTDPDIPV